MILHFFFSFAGETGTKCGQAIPRHPHTEHTQRNDRSGDHTARPALRKSHQCARAQRQKSGKYIFITLLFKL